MTLLRLALELSAILILLALGAAAGIGARIFLSFRRDLSLARDAVERGGQIAYTSAGPIEYSEKGAGIAVLSIHGAGGGYDQGLANAADLFGEGFRIIAPSRFGYLGTPIPADTSAAAQSGAHAALLSELRIDTAVVVGISAGARSAVELALRHSEQVTALILIVPGTYAPTSPVTLRESRTNALVLWLVNNGADFVWWAIEKIAPSILIRFVGVRPDLLASSPPAERERVMQIVRNIQPLSLRFRGIDIDSHPHLQPPAAISAPTIIISARDDLFNTLPAAEYAASTIAGARLVIYDTGGHLLVGRQQEVRKAVDHFLANLS